MKYVLMLTLTLASLTGCIQETNYIDSQEANFQETLLVYMSYNILKEQYGPTTERCDEEISTIRFVSFDTLVEVDRYCDPNDTVKINGYIEGCVYYDNGRSGYEGAPTIVYSPNEKEYQTTILHEVTHWYIACALGDVGNNNHTNIVWDYIPMREDSICLGYDDACGH